MAATLGTSPRLPLQIREQHTIFLQGAAKLVVQFGICYNTSYVLFRPSWYKADPIPVFCLSRTYVLSAFSPGHALFRYHLLHLSRPAHSAPAKETYTFATVLRGCRLYIASTSCDAVKATFPISVQWPNGSARIACPSSFSRDGSQPSTGTKRRRR